MERYIHDVTYVNDEVMIPRDYPGDEISPFRVNRYTDRFQIEFTQQSVFFMYVQCNVKLCVHMVNGF